MWKLDEQPDSTARNPADKKYKQPSLEDAYPIDLSWWPEEVKCCNFTIISKIW